jgi:hemerythrin
MNENAGTRWTPGLSVGHDGIDAQHRELIEFLTLLEESMGGNDIEATTAVLARFIDCTHDHFAAEERLMRDSGFGDYLAHVMRHESLLEEVRQLERNIKAGKTPVSQALLEFLRVWLFEHMRTSDRRLGHFLGEAGSPGEGE